MTKLFYFMFKNVSFIPLFLLSSCGIGIFVGTDDLFIAHVQLVDRNGINEIVSYKDRLHALQKVDFLEPQPYRKVTRIFKRDKLGRIHAKITSYHDNGNVARYLEVVDGRAHGLYQEWFASGQIKLQAHIIEGIGDLCADVEKTWVFNGISLAWNEQGNLVAKFYYDQGFLEGDGIYYHRNGSISKIVPFRKDFIDGVVMIYDENSLCIGKEEYKKGEKHGESAFEETSKCPAKKELYRDGILHSGTYWNFSSEITHVVQDGFGVQPIYEGGFLIMEKEYQNGEQRGFIKVYSEKNGLENIFHVEDGQKHGEEIVYFPFRGEESEKIKKERQPMLSIQWERDVIHGKVVTWYENGQMESEKEMVNNEKQGLSVVWYEDGNIMMIEEFMQGLLVDGKYFRRGSDTPMSRVKNGKGIVYIHDGKGVLLKKVMYDKGEPTTLAKDFQ